MVADLAGVKTSQTGGDIWKHIFPASTTSLQKPAPKPSTLEEKLLEEEQQQGEKKAPRSPPCVEPLRFVFRIHTRCCNK